ncbi:aspartate aminotransferase family protein [Haloechinothrix sp. YIM 98757]|uniref:Aspartate aminotransferase family protein n=1 Tax=Haloechinothrix aidingensis TaxID=2752311 RepID=A0A838ABL0_9PSEU|nr:aspartate aminotransferase family protein [Haloechinothrix aidingensis]MBA0126630.1 aspartate aminotransferase family protein [Haloechinothrix aidingensis]
MSEQYGVDPQFLDALLERETARFERTHQRSKKLHERTEGSMPRGVPLHWMANWPTPHPVYLSGAEGAYLTDVDGKSYVDFCLGDTGAMFGHANPLVAEAVSRQVHAGTTTMLPTEDAAAVGEELSRRFGLPYWQLATSATDANRFAIRIARIATGRDKVLVFNGKYHGSVDETQVALQDGRMVPQPGVAPNAVDTDRTTRLVEFNDVDALEQALSERDVACVLAEPAMTNVGVVPAEPGYHDALREITRRTGTLLIIDETHTISTGPGGYTRAHGLQPDMFVLGKSIAGGIPAAVYGMTAEVAETFERYTAKDGHRISHAGFGGTLAGNALTLAALRTTLEEVMTEEAYARMSALAERFERGVTEVIGKHGLPWHSTRLGARVEYLFSARAPRDGGEAKRFRVPRLEAAIHLHLLNRGVLLTPFHNMALMCPATTESDVDRHTAAFAECVAELVS